MNNTKALTDVDISASVDNIFVNDSGKVRQVSKATLFEALESAEDYQALKSEVNTLQESVNGIDTTTDTTLTKTGKAADAKTTGDKLAALKEKDDAVDAEIGQLKEELEECIDVTASRNILAFENYTRGKYYSASSGSDRYNDSFTAIDDYVKIEPNTDYVFSIFADGNYETMPNALVIQYDAGRKYISGGRRENIQDCNKC